VVVTDGGARVAVAVGGGVAVAVGKEVEVGVTVGAAAELHADRIKQSASETCRILADMAFPFSRWIE
jgi:hypothetical protein